MLQKWREESLQGDSGWDYSEKHGKTQGGGKPMEAFNCIANRKAASKSKETFFLNSLLLNFTLLCSIV